MQELSIELYQPIISACSMDLLMDKRVANITAQLRMTPLKFTSCTLMRMSLLSIRILERADTSMTNISKTWQQYVFLML